MICLNMALRAGALMVSATSGSAAWTSARTWRQMAAPTLGEALRPGFCGAVVTLWGRRLTHGCCNAVASPGRPGEAPHLRLHLLCSSRRLALAVTGGGPGRPR